MAVVAKRRPKGSISKRYKSRLRKGSEKFVGATVNTVTKKVSAGVSNFPERSRDTNAGPNEVKLEMWSSPIIYTPLGIKYCLYPPWRSIEKFVLSNHLVDFEDKKLHTRLGNRTGAHKKYVIYYPLNVFKLYLSTDRRVLFILGINSSVIKLSIPNGKVIWLS